MIIGVPREIHRHEHRVGPAPFAVARLTRRGHTVLVEDLALSVPRMRRWAFVEARENPGVGVVFAGFWIGLAGLSLTLVARLRADRHRGEPKA